MAEYGWGITEPLVSRARNELNEVPEERLSAIAAVRGQMEMRSEIEYLRSDDDFILRFLRARKFRVEEAFHLLARYFEYRQTNKNLFKKFQASEPGIKDALLDGLPGVLPGTDHRGRRIIVLYSANWDNTRYGLAAIYRAILLTLEKLIDEESSQINGFLVIVDWSEFTFKQSSWLNPRILRLMIEGLQDCFPARFTAIHFVNQPWYIEAIFKMLRPFLKEKNRSKIIMHGINLMTLHQHVRKEALPAELGGTQAPYNNQSWAHTLLGDETFSFGHQHIYWPSRTPPPHKLEMSDDKVKVPFLPIFRAVFVGHPPNTDNTYGLHPAFKKAMDLQPTTNLEALTLAFAAENNISLSAVPELIDFSMTLARDKKALDNLHMTRTAASYKLRLGLAKTLEEELLEELWQCCFSLNIDEVKCAPKLPPASRSETFPMDQFSHRETDATQKGTYLDEEFFLID